MYSSFTIDVEDGVSLAMRDIFYRDMEQTDRVVKHTGRVLDLLARYETKGTFFVLGMVAERFPGLIKQIAQEGHELGIHGYNHYQFFRMTPEEAFKELSDAKDRVENLTGVKVLGHRAPAFSITPETKWGLDVIARAGFTYDSSIMPAKGRRYGWRGFSKEITHIKTESGRTLVEVPMSVGRFLGKELPVCGGGYLRLFPFWFTQKMFEQIGSERPVIVYMHPYELDTERYPDEYFEALKASKCMKQIKMRSMWINRKNTYYKLEELLKRYPFVPLYQLVDQYKQKQNCGEVIL